MRSLRRRFGTLRWRLMLSCFVAAFTAMMTLVLAFVLVPGIVTMTGPQRPVSLEQGLRKLAPRIAPYLRQEPPDRSQIIATLTANSQPIQVTAAVATNLHSDGSVIPGKNATLLVVSRDGQALATLPAAGSSKSALGHLLRLSGAKTVMAAALRDDTDMGALIKNAPGEPTVAAAPIVDSGVVRGALLIGLDLATLLRPLYLFNLLALVPTIILFCVIASIFGAIFGLLTARGMIRRLVGLTSAANAWSRGDFDASARDPSTDELGQLARDLNRMAEQLQGLLQDRQQLAVFEERNRLARELHDSVKQQMFALALLLGSAQLEVEEQSEARRILDEAERIAINAQQEMTALIRALRPVALADKDLAAALRGFCEEWRRRYGIACAVSLPGTLTMSPETEQQVFRVAQEALANVAKHSGATRVEIHATVEQGTLALRIRDNGRGFDVAQANGRGLGLSSMRERIEALGGSLHITSAVGGTRIELRAPLAPRNAGQAGNANAGMTASHEAP